MKTLILTLVIFFSWNCFAQSKEKTCSTCPDLIDISTDITNLPQIDSFDGTYQITVKKGDSFSVTEAFFTFIQNERKENEEVTMDLGNGRTLSILSYSQIKSPSFIPYSSPYSVSE